MGLPKLVLASITISSGGKLKSQCNTNVVPTGEAEGTFKEKMHAGLFHNTITDGTVVVIKIHILPS